MSSKQKYRPLLISSHRGRWRNSSGGEPGDKGFKKVKPNILARDEHRCVYCDIRMESSKNAGEIASMEAHHFDCNHENNDPKNLGTTDHFCHAYNHIGFLGKMAVMGILPEIGVIDMNHLLRTIGVALRDGDDEMKADAREIYEIIRSSSDDFARVWGTKNPADIGNALLALPKSSYEVRDVTLDGVRIIFDLDSLVNKKFIERVAKNAHGYIKTNAWNDIAQGNLEEDLGGWEESGRQIEIGAKDERREKESGE